MTGFPRDGFSLGYQIDPSKFNKKTGFLTGKSAEAIEINREIQHVRSELLRHYNLLRAVDPVVTPTLIKNSYKGINREQSTLLEVCDFHNQ